MNRREFIRRSSRIGILTAISGGVIFLASKKRIDWTCTENKTCNGCIRYATCDWEQAQKNRKNEQQ